MKLSDTESKTDLAEFLSSVLNKVVDTIKDAYDTKTWDVFLGNSPVGVRTMVFWALCGKRVSLEDRLNGISVKEARSSGILMLSEVEGSPNTYVILLPLVLLRALNKSICDIDDKFLDPVHIFDDREFEKAMCGLRVLRQNLLVGMGKKMVTYRELYPYALGTKEVLDRQIKLSKLEVVFPDGSSATHDSIHKYPPTAIPVLNCTEETLDATEVFYYSYSFIFINF
jgi:hypothetical protein